MISTPVITRAAEIRVKKRALPRDLLQGSDSPEPRGTCPASLSGLGLSRKLPGSVLFLRKRLASKVEVTEACCCTEGRTDWYCLWMNVLLLEVVDSLALEDYKIQDNDM